VRTPLYFTRITERNTLNGRFGSSVALMSGTLFLPNIDFSGRNSYDTF